MKTILLVEDNEMSRDMLSRRLNIKPVEIGRLRGKIHALLPEPAL